MIPALQAAGTDANIAIAVLSCPRDSQAWHSLKLGKRIQSRVSYTPPRSSPIHGVCDSRDSFNHPVPSSSSLALAPISEQRHSQLRLSSISSTGSLILIILFPDWKEFQQQNPSDQAYGCTGELFQPSLLCTPLFESAHTGWHKSDFLKKEPAPRTPTCDQKIIPTPPPPKKTPPKPPQALSKTYFQVLKLTGPIISSTCG